jgi:2-iminobutanoate/2-iminopropanoate deaminase
MRRQVLLAAAILAPAAVVAQQPATVKQVVVPGSGVLSDAIRVGDILYVSGKLGMRRDAPDSTIEGQTRVALENIKRVVEQAGTTMPNVVKCTVFLTNVADFQAMNRVYREFFPTDPPTRSTVVVAALVVPNAKIEIECMAAMPKQ